MNTAIPMSHVTRMVSPFVRATFAPSSAKPSALPDSSNSFATIPNMPNTRMYHALSATIFVNPLRISVKKCSL